MKEFLGFLRRYLWWWLTPLLLLAAGLAFVAWALASSPDSPFTSDLR